MDRLVGGRLFAAGMLVVDHGDAPGKRLPVLSNQFVNVCCFATVVDHDEMPHLIALPCHIAERTPQQQRSLPGSHEDRDRGVRARRVRCWHQPLMHPVGQRGGMPRLAGASPHYRFGFDLTWILNMPVGIFTTRQCAVL